MRLQPRTKALTKLSANKTELPQTCDNIYEKQTKTEVSLTRG